MARLRFLITVCVAIASAAPSPASLSSDISILIYNDLQGKDSPAAHSGVLVLNPLYLKDAAAACEALGEALWSPDGEGMTTDLIQPNLDFLNYQGCYKESTWFWIAPSGRQSRRIGLDGKIKGWYNGDPKLPVLCTQTAPFSNETAWDNGENWRVEVAANNETLVGFRDRHSFRFLGIRYAEQPLRFTYSEPYVGSGIRTPATDYAPQCVQGRDVGAEDCLFLNIFTPYLPVPVPSSPESDSAKKCSSESHKKPALKPVMFWIHGGAYTGGTGNDPTNDGGNLASRGDVVVVTINYRLATLGFLALPDGVLNGNFGFQDQILALKWVKENIAEFGGDPDNITIFGQSAGAASVRAMMESPVTKGMFRRAIPMSNLGGLNYGATYSDYLTIEEQMEECGNDILEMTGCNSTELEGEAIVDCLRGIDPDELVSLDIVARYLVVDGTYLTKSRLQVQGGKADYDLMMGITRDDGMPIGLSRPDPPQNGESYSIVEIAEYFNSNNYPVPPAAIHPLPLAFYEGDESKALFNTTALMSTNGVFRCIDQATVASLLKNQVLEKVYYYEFDRTYQFTGWPGDTWCEPPVSDEFPFGNPKEEYFKCHSGEVYYAFGTLGRQGLPMRDGVDLGFEQFVMDGFAAFAATGNPNREEGWLKARGFEGTRKEVWGRDGGVWEPATDGDLKMRVLEGPGGRDEGFRQVEGCEWLGLGLDYYEEEEE